MSVASILYLISFYSAAYGMDPMVMRSVAIQESNLNSNAVGALGEIGVYQLRPEFVKEVSRKQLFTPATNIRIAIKRLHDLKKKYGSARYLVAWNGGDVLAKRVKHPLLFKYVQEVNQRVALMEKE